MCTAELPVSVLQPSGACVQPNYLSRYCNHLGRVYSRITWVGTATIWGVCTAELKTIVSLKELLLKKKSNHWHISFKMVDVQCTSSCYSKGLFSFIKTNSISNHFFLIQNYRMAKSNRNISMSPFQPYLNFIMSGWRQTTNQKTDIISRNLVFNKLLEHLFTLECWCSDQERLSHPHHHIQSAPGPWQ